MAIGVLAHYFRVARQDYAQMVARYIPVRVTASTGECVVGLQAAADQLFKKPVENITSEEMDRIILFSVAPGKHPLATQTK